MSTVAVKKVNEQEKPSVPIFEEIEQRLEQVRRRAFELFEGRGGEFGKEIEDWLQAENDVLGKAGVDFQEKPGQFEIAIELPGFQANQTEVTATGTELAIHAARKGKDGSEEVYRRFEFSRPIRADQIAAKLDAGTLRIVVPCESKGLSEGGSQRTIAVA